jgi:hypothetical protein
MKAIAFILIVISTGCAAAKVPPLPATIAAAAPEIELEAPALEPRAEPKAIVTPAPQFVIPLVYQVPLTNCWLETSADLAHWARCDFVVTNGDWLVHPAGPYNFYRVGGERVP